MGLRLFADSPFVDVSIQAIELGVPVLAAVFFVGLVPRRLSLENQRLSSQLQRALRELRASRARVLAAADGERRRIERDLHDGAQQRLVALRIQLALAEDLVVSEPDHCRRKLQSLGEAVEETLEEIRALAGRGYPPVLAEHGLPDALRAAALRIPVAATVQPDGVGRCPPELERAVYFCCVEAMQNASKHARDAHVLTILLEQHDELRFEVRDDGAGFNGDVQSGAGLTNMRDRLDAVGGTLEIRSVPGEGTVVAGSVPLAGDPLRSPSGQRQLCVTDDERGGPGEGQPPEHATRSYSGARLKCGATDLVPGNLDQLEFAVVEGPRFLR